ncbi:MAG: helix-turn-helix domain-containing protein, partial [Candidatus Accumulibacter sp.]|nr:helix-turn-helix domain-containing protein [Accumulibacter sp.]
MEAYEGWNAGRLSQAEAGLLLGMSERNFRRYLSRYEEEGETGLRDKRLESCADRGAPVDEVLAVQARYRERHPGWNVRHFHA